VEAASRITTLSEGRALWQVKPLIVFFPAAFLSDALDPRATRRRRSFGTGQRSNEAHGCALHSFLRFRLPARSFV
jgi:hypothetical protein